MISISPLSDNAPAPLAAPHPKFRALCGKAKNIRLYRKPFVRQRGNTAARENGLRFEAQVHQSLSAAFSNEYWPEPRISFIDDSGARNCYPDGLLIINPFVFVLEIKIQHMPEAWWQLRRLYLPLLRQQFPVVGGIEIVKSYDPAMPFPEPVNFVDDLAKYIVGCLQEDTIPPQIAVVRWRK